MKININIFLLLMMGLSVQAETVGVEYSGNMRVGAQYHDSEGNSGADLALGGNLHAETTPLAGLSFGATLQTSHALFHQNDAFGVPFCDAASKSYTILSEAYVKGVYENTILILGRQTIDTPFADSDDIGMIPNTFEAYTVMNQDIQDVSLVYTYVRNMSGVDADIPESFSDINGGSGIHIVGMEYQLQENMTLSGWFYDMPSLAKYTYLEVGYENSYNSVQYTLEAQVVLQDFEKSDSANIFGLSASLAHEESALAFSVAYNKSIDAAADNGFGGGPFFTSSENMTLAEAGEDGEVFTYGVEWGATEALTLALFNANLYDNQNHDGYEVDIVANYSVTDNFSFDAIYSKIDNANVSGDKFDNVRVFVNYSF